MAFNFLYVYDYVAKLCRQKAAGIQNHGNEHVSSIGQDKSHIENIKGLNLVAVKFFYRSNDL
jgi:hypothetical protein